MIPGGVELQVFRWKQRPGGRELHRRFILTERGGIWIDQGLDAGNTGEMTDVGLMLEQVRLERWQDYDRVRTDGAGGRLNTTFEFVDAFRVNSSGCSRIQTPNP